VFFVKERVVSDMFGETRDGLALVLDAFAVPHDVCFAQRLEFVVESQLKNEGEINVMPE
jgi:hypothetical protein